MEYFRSRWSLGLYLIRAVVLRPAPPTGVSQHLPSCGGHVQPEEDREEHTKKVSTLKFVQGKIIKEGAALHIYLQFMTWKWKWFHRSRRLLVDLYVLTVF